MRLKNANVSVLVDNEFFEMVKADKNIDFVKLTEHVMGNQNNELS